jgi:HK97 gp10 family phage protein
VAQFKGIGSFVGLKTGHTTYEIAQYVQQRAKDYVPIITGNLQSGILIAKGGRYDWEVTASSLDGDGGQVRSDGSAAKNSYEYADFVEFGTSKMAPRRFMSRAFSDGRIVANAKLVQLARELELKFRVTTL